MDIQRPGKRRYYGIPVLTFFVIFIMAALLYLSVKQQSVTQQKEQYRYIAINQSNVIKDYFDTVTARAFTIGTLISSNDGQTDSFMDAAARCYDEIYAQCGIHLKNLAIAPGGVVEQVYPLAGNESLMGFDFMDVSRPGNQEAVEAYGKKEMVVTQPFELVQGGIGMGARLPVFLDDGQTQTFWGLVTITMDFEEFIRSVHLDSLTAMGIAYDVWYTDSDGQPVILAQSDAPLKNPVSCEFSMMNLTWNISLSPIHSWHSLPEYLMGFGVILFIALLCALTMRDKIRIHEANDQLTQMAFFDALTLCHSRQYVNSVLVDPHSGKWRIPDMKYSAVILDVDHFKTLNDTYGHDFGDRALIAVANVLMSHIREEDGDCVIRFGGDEFILLYNDVTRERFEGKLKSIVEAVRGIRIDGHPDVRLSVSVGGEYYSGPDHSLYYEIVKRADAKLYHSKENGRDQYTL